MPLTAFQRRVCRLLADERKRSGESYVAGGVALNDALGGTRRSDDIDLFHDTQAALAATWDHDQATLLAASLNVAVRRHLPAFVEAEISDATDSTLVQWVQDSAYRFFPLLEHPEFGLTLHPVDLATNKLLALASRREPRDWIDVLQCDATLQPLGYLAWAATGKDPGLSPTAIIEEAARTHYNQAEIDELQFDGPSPDAASLSAQWHRALQHARQLIPLLPLESVGKLVFDGEALARAEPQLLPSRLACLTFHEGCIRGALPEIRPDTDRARPSRSKKRDDDLER